MEKIVTLRNKQWCYKTCTLKMFLLLKINAFKLQIFKQDKVMALSETTNLCLDK